MKFTVHIIHLRVFVCIRQEYLDKNPPDFPGFLLKHECYDVKTVKDTFVPNEGIDADVYIDVNTHTQV